MILLTFLAAHDGLYRCLLDCQGAEVICACGFEGVEVWFLRLDGGRGFSPQCRYCQQGGRSPVPPPHYERVLASVKPTTSQYRAAAHLGVDPFELAIRQARKQKFCTGCMKWKKVYSFNRHAGQPDGRHHRCKACRAEEYRRWLIENMDDLVFEKVSR